MKKRSGLKENQVSVFEASYRHLKFDIAGFIVQILCKFTFSSLQLNAYHTHMLASHSRQLSALWFIRIRELDIHGPYEFLLC